MLNDDRLLEAFQKQLEELTADGQEPTAPRPELNGYTREAKGLHEIAVQLAWLRRTLSKNLSIPLPAEPVFPSERVQTMRDQAVVDDLFDDITRAMNKRKE